MDPIIIGNILEIIKFLEANDVQTRVYFVGNITHHPAFHDYLQYFPNFHRIMKDGFLLGCSSWYEHP